MYLFTSSIILLAIGACTLFVMSEHSSVFKNSITQGLDIWASVLPTVAWATFLMVVLINLAPPSMTDVPQALLLKNELNTFERVLLLAAGSLFATKFGNLIAASVTLYCYERILLTQQADFSGPMVAILSTATLIAVLGDKMPWHDQRHPNQTADRVREILTLLLCFAALASIFAAALKMPSLSYWVATKLELPITQEYISMFLLVILVGWLAVALGFARQLVIPAIALPSLAVIAFLTGWEASVLVTPFCLALALSLTLPSINQTSTLYH